MCSPPPPPPPYLDAYLHQSRRILYTDLLSWCLIRGSWLKEKIPLMNSWAGHSFFGCELVAMCCKKIVWKAEKRTFLPPRVLGKTLAMRVGNFRKKETGSFSLSLYMCFSLHLCVFVCAILYTCVCVCWYLRVDVRVGVFLYMTASLYVFVCFFICACVRVCISVRLWRCDCVSDSVFLHASI